jgi:hypothetical protein
MEKRLLNYINKITDIKHSVIQNMTVEEQSGGCLVYVSAIDYKDTVRYVKRVQSSLDKWYASEISYEEYCYWIVNLQYEMFKKVSKIQGLTGDMNVESLIDSAMKKIQQYQAIEEETMKLPEEDLVDERSFKKMMGY